MTSALLLTAGLGTRLRPLSDVRAKPAVPVAGEPLVRRSLAWLASQSIRDVVLNLHHRPATITAVVGDGSDLGVRVRYSWEQPRVLGSAGGPRKALPLVDADPLLIVNGDTLTDVKVAELEAAHARSGAVVTLALVPNIDHQHYGGVVLDDDRRVTGFVSRGPAAAGSFHFIGVQIAARRVFEPLPLDEPFATIGGVYDDWIRTNRGAIRGFVSAAGFWDIGTAADYWRTSHELAVRARHANALGGRGCTIHPFARVTRSILWDDVEIGPDAVIEECIVTDGVKVTGRAVYRRSILVAGQDGVVASPLDTGERPSE
ncbi:MAG TPA: sugar phosphate nucleotidyltransferase [Vicinamibacterales bacterium]|nr:sugar phosphate nucleotidyltransferase [Vicinamibacterales bacterium]